MTYAVVPAAGRASRFGAPKLLAPIGGEPLIDRTIRSLLDAGVARVVVVVAPDSPLAAPDSASRLLADERVTCVANESPDRGMLSSIRVGLLAVAIDASDDSVVLVLPADMPFVRSATVARVIETAGRMGVVVSPTFEGRRGHPIALTPTAARGVRTAADGITLSDALEPFKSDRYELAVDDPGIHRDVDRPADLATPGDPPDYT